VGRTLPFGKLRAGSVRLVLILILLLILISILILAPHIEKSPVLRSSELCPHPRR